MTILRHGNHYLSCLCVLTGVVATEYRRRHVVGAAAGDEIDRAPVRGRVVVLETAGFILSLSVLNGRHGNGAADVGLVPREICAPNREFTRVPDGDGTSPSSGTIVNER